MIKRKPIGLLFSAWALMAVAMAFPVGAEQHVAESEAASQASPDLIQGGQEEYWEQAVQDAWLDGKLELALTVNRHLNPIAIDTKVVAGIAYLSGTVESDIDRALAEEIALGIDGINEVNNKLEVDQAATRARQESLGLQEVEPGRNFAQWYEDVTITAAIKSRLLASEEVDGLDIDVTTRNGVVTLSGSVSDGVTKGLAGEVAENTAGVLEVDNQLQVAAE